MGIFDFIKQGAQELFIARPEADKELLVSKWPDPTIPMKAQVTVGQDEVAVFFKDGKQVGILSEGRYTLDSANIPFLSVLLDKVTGGNLFMAELWFITTREVSGMKFGGNVGLVGDPLSGIAVEVMAHGEYSLQIEGPGKAIAFFGRRKFTTDAQFTNFFGSLVLKVLKDRIGEHLAERQMGILTLPGQTMEIEQLVLDGVKPEVEPYGIRVVRLGNFSVVIDDKDEQELKENYKESARINRAKRVGMQDYQQFAAAEAMLGAGKGMEKGGGGSGSATEGAGLGIGFGMAQMFQQQAQQRQQQPPAPAAPAGGPATVACPKCQAQVAPGKFCAECGGELQQKQPFCSACGKPKAAGVKFCSECGAQQSG
jgi:membrane protease subunit (stomatin/prohibitin family)